VEEGIRAICRYARCEVIELNVQRDHVHLVMIVPRKQSISNLMGRVNGQTSIELFKQFRELRKKPYRDNHFWAQGYCVDTLVWMPRLSGSICGFRRSERDRKSSYDEMDEQ